MHDPTISDIIEAHRLATEHVAALPQAHIGERAWSVLRAMFYADRTATDQPDPMATMLGTPIRVDPDVRPGVVEFRHPDGRLDIIRLTDDGTENHAL